MGQLDKEDLAQMNENYFKSLEKERLVEVAKNLHQLATDLWEKKQENSQNSSQPPSKDNPYTSLPRREEESPSSDSLSESDQTEQNQTEERFEKKSRSTSSRKPGKQPGTGYISEVEGRARDLKLTEYVLVGPMLATFIASLGVRYRMSRTKIQEFLIDWTRTELSTGTIDRCIREAGIACMPVVEELVEQLQQADILHLDETHWYVRGKLHWLWVAVATKTAVFHIGSRRKEELSHLVKEAFLGWLVSDGYAAYRSHPQRQRCIAHLIRKAVAITGAINQKAATIGQWILDDLRALIATITQGSEDARGIRKRMAGLRRVCYLGKKVEHTKLQALAKEILNDWDAVVAFVKHPELPPTNNEAERALRHAVIARNIGFGTRTSEGSLAYSSLLSVIETCRLRDINPWIYIAEVLASARQGLSPPPFPLGS